jgi:Rad3-related DNA helicase
MLFYWIFGYNNKKQLRRTPSMSESDLFYRKRQEAQEHASDTFAQMKSDDISLQEFPTGFGKTHIDILSAIKYQQKHKVPVIISTNTNKNALGVLETFKNISGEYGLDEKSMVAEIGRNNYIDIERLYNAIEENSMLFPEITTESLKEHYMQTSTPLKFANNILLYHFLNNYGYESSKIAAFSAFLQDDVKTISPKSLSHIENLLLENKIVVTNHAYLIILFRHYGNPKNKNVDPAIRELLFNTPIIMDEVHTLYDAAQSIFTNRFSLFRLKYSITALLSLEKKSLSLPSRKALNMILAHIIDVEKKILLTTDTLQIQYLLASFKTGIGGSTKLNRVARSIKQNTMQTTDGEKYARFVTTELNELAIINLHKTIGTKVALSPKGFPTVEVNNKIPSYELRNTVWLKHRGPFMGLSGTLRTVTGDDREAYRWIIERLGLFLVDEDEIISSLSSVKDMGDEVKTFILQQNRILNAKIENIKTKKHVSLFNKSNYLFTVVKDASLKIPLGTKKQRDSYEREKLRWRINVGRFIANNLRYNSLVLVVGYEDAEIIAEHIMSQREDIAVHYAKEGVSMHDTVEKYKRDINEGKTACLVGTDQYYTGLDLAGEYLLELYIGKIPFQNPAGKIGNKIYKHFSFSKIDNYRNETMLKFLQGKGRPIRGFEDRAILYMLDDRILDSHREIYRAFLNDAAIQNDYNHILKNRHKFFNKKGVGKHSSIYTLFYDYFGNIPTKEMLNALKVDDDEKVLIDHACEFILNADLIQNKENFIQTVAAALGSEKYSVWQLFFKLVLQEHNKKDQIEKTIIENRLFGHEDIDSLSKAFFCGEPIPYLDAFYS